MIAPGVRTELDRLALTERVLWFAQTGAIFLFGIVIHVVQAERTGTDIPWLREGFAAMAIVMAAVAYLLRRSRSSDDAIRNAAAKAPDPSRRLIPVAQAHFTTLIVSLALHEAIALFGLVVGILRNDVMEFVPFAVAAVLLNLFLFPGPIPLPENALRLLGD